MRFSPAHLAVAVSAAIACAGFAAVPAQATNSVSMAGSKLTLVGDARVNNFDLWTNPDGSIGVYEKQGQGMKATNGCRPAAYTTYLCIGAASIVIQGKGEGDILSPGDGEIAILTYRPDIFIPMTIDGGPGNDSIGGGTANDILLGRGGNDFLADFYGGGDWLLGGEDDDTIYGDPFLLDNFGEKPDGVNVMMGEGGNDIVQNGTPVTISGKQYYYPGKGTGYIYGGTGNDTLRSGAAWDYISGDADDDRINSAADGGKDDVYCGEGPTASDYDEADIDKGVDITHGDCERQY